MMHRLVVSTGGGAVIRPINWYVSRCFIIVIVGYFSIFTMLNVLFRFVTRKHMRSGISVWLDVPLECLARRISAVGTDSRPLLHGESGDAYSKVGWLVVLMAILIHTYKKSCKSCGLPVCRLSHACLHY